MSKSSSSSSLSGLSQFIGWPMLVVGGLSAVSVAFGGKPIISVPIKDPQIAVVANIGLGIGAAMIGFKVKEHKSFAFAVVAGLLATSLIVYGNYKFDEERGRQVAGNLYRGVTNAAVGGVTGAVEAYTPEQCEAVDGYVFERMLTDYELNSTKNGCASNAPWTKTFHGELNCSTGCKYKKL